METPMPPCILQSRYLSNVVPFFNLITSPTHQPRHPMLERLEQLCDLANSKECKILTLATDMIFVETSSTQQDPHKQQQHT
jgi:hypothetical protein